jgi:hypothetical protein
MILPFTIPLQWKLPNADMRYHVLMRTLSLWNPSQLKFRYSSAVPFDYETAEVSNPDSPGSRATCPRHNRRPRLIREIATHDFDDHELSPYQTPNAEPRWASILPAPMG